MELNQMNKKQSTSIEQMKSIINRADNSSTRITVKLSETTYKKIQIITSITSATFKVLLKDALIDTLPVFENLFEDLINSTDKNGTSPLESHSTDKNLIQKTFVITNNSNRVLEELVSLLKINKSSLFSMIIYTHYKFNYENKLESARKNLIIYKKLVKSIKKLMKKFDETSDEVTILLKDHDPGPEELHAYSLSDHPIECFLSNFEETADIALFNSLCNIEEAIKNCHELISLAEEASPQN